MIRKFLALFLALAWVIVPATARASTPDFSYALFSRGKDAVNLIAYGEYTKAIEKLEFSGSSPSAKDLATFVEEELDDIIYGTVQTDVAVAFYLNDRWVLAIPVTEPVDDSVQVFLLSSVNGEQFDAYRASSWKNVQSNVQKSGNAIWNIPYEPELPEIFVDE